MIAYLLDEMWLLIRKVYIGSVRGCQEEERL